MSGRFIALEGIDGVGKTALARHLADLSYEGAIAKLADRAAHETTVERGTALVFVSRRQISGTSAYAAKIMDHLATMLWHSGDALDLSDAFWVPLQAAWFTAHSETVLGPVLDADFDVVVDGWLYKFFAKLLLQGFTEADLDVIFKRVRMPDSVVLLQGDVGAVYDRRDHFRPAELGMHARYGTLEDLGRHTFVDYQTKTARNLEGFAEQGGWQTAWLAPDEPPEATARHLEPLIALLRTPHSDLSSADASQDGDVRR